MCVVLPEVCTGRMTGACSCRHGSDMATITKGVRDVGVAEELRARSRTGSSAGQFSLHRRAGWCSCQGVDPKDRFG